MIRKHRVASQSSLRKLIVNATSTSTNIVDTSTAHKKCGDRFKTPI